MAFDYANFEANVRAACPKHAERLLMLCIECVITEPQALVLAQLGDEGVRRLTTGQTPDGANDLATRLKSTGCTDRRAARILSMGVTDATALNLAKLSARAFTVACEDIELSKSGKGASQPAAADADDDRDDEEADDETLSKIAANATLTATDGGTSTMSTAKLRKALAKKKSDEEDADEVDEDSLKRNGLKAPCPLDGSDPLEHMKRKRTLSQNDGSPGDNQRGVLDAVRRLNSGT
jgi:hypothetical protein